MQGEAPYTMKISRYAPCTAPTLSNLDGVADATKLEQASVQSI